jgi:hypothetical protein
LFEEMVKGRPTADSRKVFRTRDLRVAAGKQQVFWNTAASRRGAISRIGPGLARVELLIHFNALPFDGAGDACFECANLPMVDHAFRH